LLTFDLESRRLTEDLRKVLNKIYDLLIVKVDVIIKDKEMQRILNKIHKTELFYNRRLQSLVALELLCGAPHKISYVAKPVMYCILIYPLNFRFFSIY